MISLQYTLDLNAELLVDNFAGGGGASTGIEFEGEFATVEGYVIVDIGMRMLTPRELFRAQGFPNDYVIDRAWVIDPKTGVLTEITLTKEQQIRMCGNSVCPPIAQALVRANSADLAVWQKRELPQMAA